MMSWTQKLGVLCLALLGFFVMMDKRKNSTRCDKVSSIYHFNIEEEDYIRDRTECSRKTYLPNS